MKSREQTPRTGPFQDHCGKGDQGSSSEEELMDAQPFQATNSKVKDQRSNETMKEQRPTSPSIQVTDEFIAEHSLVVTQAISLKENLGNWAQALASAKSEKTAYPSKGDCTESGCLNNL
ncbi:hypothetical protein HNY73_007776 [Argiope bruennichi]|uniref:Uncharacterized protein n=1 Tax=Argiope bruennichi TaxID=94029 RepID=A0A8T0FEY2_ARGBR|nr:hypothetical protein HNY73_007776 [Argiope bruennichi]